MPKLPRITPKRLVAALKRAGFYEVRQAGSHLRLERRNLQVTVPIHPGDLKPRVIRSILRQADMSVEELDKVL